MPLLPTSIVQDYAAYRGIVRGWLQRDRKDLVLASLDALKKYLQPQRTYDAVIANDDYRENVQAFIADLPADQARSLKQWLKERDFNGLHVPRLSVRQQR
ncbi:MAG: hypothetical protein HYR85_23980 [Planctomycetes bacterium]|nr:hypothetical protein [Planctomycetota bacterium]